MDPEGLEVHTERLRTQLREMLNAVEHDGEHITVLRYSKPAAMIVPVGWYEDARAALAMEAAR